MLYHVKTLLKLIFIKTRKLPKKQNVIKISPFPTHVFPAHVIQLETKSRFSHFSTIDLTKKETNDVN